VVVSVVVFREAVALRGPGDMMKNSKSLFTQEEINEIEASISAAEQRTSGEVVPVVATVSGRYDRAEDLFAFIFSLIVLAISWFGLQGLSGQFSWGEEPVLALTLPAVIAILVLAFFVGLALAHYIPGLRLMLISQQEMQEEVERKARESFYQLKLRKTEGATGILIFISLFEHRVHIIGDDAISAKLSQADWQDICDTILTGFKKGNPAEGLTNAIRQSGDLLAGHFPIKEGDENELSDQLHLID